MESPAVSTFLYGAETWTTKALDKKVLRDRNVVCIMGGKNKRSKTQ